ncbi:hypothetical protein SAMN05421847_0260 [Halpernia humi]|uniref:Carboxypeptidase-like regulatory domain-containing protein n=1 Tax=Halpernia humi TaxID=493375 RepID=A0A1H5SVC8_9FLAO|nr:DUF5686 family protein [Halpernia humi]SEF53821.1 hypothetical protein SAMN05421847_0260 [Halpernia humi]
MKNFSIVLFLFLFSLGFSQSQLEVLSASDRAPISNAKVSCNNKILGFTNTNGIINFNSKCKKVNVSAVGFYDNEVLVDKKMDLLLTKVDANVKDIEAVVLTDKSDPRALKILDEVNARYKQNSPESLDSYSYRSYDKISLDIDKDSLSTYRNFVTKRSDSLKNLPENNLSKKKKKDSLDNSQFVNLIKDSKFFLWERVQEHLYSQKYGEKINVLDNRVSGLNDPIYELMTLRSNRLKIPKEIRKENRDLYRFFLTDSIEIDGRENYVIRFRQINFKEAKMKRKYNGYLYVDKASYALKKIESNSKIKSDGSITSTWIPFDNKWFLKKESLKLKAGNIAFKENSEKNESDKKEKKFGNYIYVNSDYFDFKTPIEVKAKEFTGYTMAVEKADGTSLSKYRTEPLTKREKETYVKIDSVGKKYNIDQKVGVFTNLLKGKLRLGKIDIDAAKVIGYNQYEGLRLGLGVKLNEKFNPYISPDGYAAFGFKDQTWKYGLGVDIKTTLKKNSFFRAEYHNDVQNAGKFNENQWNFKMKLMNAGVNLHNDNYYHFEGFKVAYENDISNGITLNVSAKKDKEEAKFPYSFRNLGNKFDNFSTMITLKFSTNSKNIMTPSGKYTYEQNYPELYLNYEQSFKTFGGDLQYSRFDALFIDTFKSNLGVTGVRLFGGMSSSDAPIWHQFQMNGLGPKEITGLFSHFNLTSYLGFATMEGGKYYSNKFLGYYFTHRIPWYFKSFGKNISSFDVVYRGTIGNMNNPEYHQFNFKPLDHLYQEVGLEWNNFFATQFNLGLFYRIGYYQTSVFNENFAIQLKLKALGF